jgi:hypothetical protein
MSFIKVKRFKYLEDLIAEANLIATGDQNSDEDTNTKPTENEMYNELLDGFVDRAIPTDIYEDQFLIERAETVATYLKYCQERLAQITQALTDELLQADPSTVKVQQLVSDQGKFAKRIDLLDQIFQAAKARENEEVKRLAESISSQIESIKDLFIKSYETPLAAAAKQNKKSLAVVESQEADPVEKKAQAAEILRRFDLIEQIATNLPDETQEQISRDESYHEDKIKSNIGDEAFAEISKASGFDREEAVLLNRIVKLNYTTFTTQKEFETEIADIRAKINALHGSSKVRVESRPETIKYMNTLVDQAEAVILKRIQDKSIQVDRAKGIHFDFNVKLKLYEKVELPVTGKQIADESTVMKLRKGMQSLLDLFLSGAGAPITPAGQAWADLGKRVHDIYAKTLNTAAKATGRLLKGREGEMKADAISRMFIPNIEVIDKKKSATFEDAVAPGLSAQVPGSIGGMGAIVAPTPTSIGSGDNFNPPRKKKNDKKDKRVLEFNDFVNMFLK